MFGGILSGLCLLGGLMAFASLAFQTDAHPGVGAGVITFWPLRPPAERRGWYRGPGFHLVWFGSLLWNYGLIALIAIEAVRLFRGAP